MSTHDAFLKLIAQNEDDPMVRLVYADWLEEQGEHEEADRQRKWKTAKDWLARLCKENSTPYETISYEELIAFGYRVTRDEIRADRIYMNNEAMWGALRKHGPDFWMHWGVVTGQPLPPGLDDEGFHRWVCCSHEVYHWFGLPDQNPYDEETGELL